MAGQHKGFLFGDPLEPRAIAAMLYAGGWKGVIDLWEMLATVLAESDGHPDAHGFNLALIGTLYAGDQVLDWHPPQNPEPSDPSHVAGPRLTVVQPRAGILRDGNGHTRQRTSSTLVVSSIDVGLGQVNIAVMDWETERHRMLRQSTKNLYACRLLWLKRRLQPWHAYTSGIALDPHAAGRYAHRAARGVANFIGERGNLAPVPLFDYRQGG